jgi:exoribonuclease R
MYERIVGTLELASKYRYGLTRHGVPLYLFRPYDEALPEFIVGSKTKDQSQNQIALVDVPVDAVAAPAGQTKPRGSLVRMIGPVGDPVAEREGLLLHYCPARQKVSELPEEDHQDDENRIELTEATGWTVFHVDPPGCRDIDDAIAFHAGTRSWAIIIADAASSVPAGSEVDKAAAAIGSTFYDCDGHVVSAMLPPTISEDSASLLPGTRRRGIALLWTPDESERFKPVWCAVAHSFTYDSFVDSEVAIRLNVKQDPHDWIADMMIRYNAAAARLLKENGVGILRSQDPATADKVASWPASLRHLANEAATYTLSVVGGGHAGLGLTAYTHASSPLRRYVDLCNQRLIKAILRSESTTSIEIPIEHLNARASANKRWGRDLTFLTHVTPGRVHEIDIVWVSETRVWVPAWSRLIRIRHEEEPLPSGSAGRIKIFCDPTRRNWKRRVLTAKI